MWKKCCIRSDSNGTEKMDLHTQFYCCMHFKFCLSFTINFLLFNISKRFVCRENLSCISQFTKSRSLQQATKKIISFKTYRTLCINWIKWIHVVCVFINKNHNFNFLSISKGENCSLKIVKIHVSKWIFYSNFSGAL